MAYLAHFAASYILVRIADLFLNLNIYDIFFIIAMGVIVDIDIILCFFIKRPAITHHFLFTHTPLSGFILGLIMYIISYPFFSAGVIIFGILSFIMHLFLDNIPFLFYILKIDKKSIPALSYISWTWPFDRNIKKYESLAKKDIKNKKPFKEYFHRFGYMIIVELVIVGAAVILFIIQ